VIEGGVPETTALLEQRFDHIFYTGNGTVGRIVMTAAAKHLTPVTLELGGKSPCIVDRSADLEVAARRIVWGKFTNAGQTCVAPDYILCEPDLEPTLSARLEKTIAELYGDDPQKSPDYGRIINGRHFERLTRLLDGADLVCGGETDAESRYIAPTVVRGVTADSPLMADEIFGPILPIVTVDNIDRAIGFVNERPRPLALYVFTAESGVADRVLERTTSGGGCVNDVVAHLGIHELPFGGVGASGMGAYHGRAGFETFSHRRSVLHKSTMLDVRLRYPPYDESKLKWIRRLL
jgi:aldehyde dehydrogenase (NAD+)